MAVVAVAFMFRRPIATLLDKIRKFAVGNVTFEIADKLDEAEKIVQEEAPDQVVPAVTQSNDRIKALQYPPDYVVISEWRTIEVMLRKIAQSRDISFRAPSRITTRELVRMELIKPTTAELILDLSSIRNRVAHGEAEVSQADALRFLDLASIVKADLNRVPGPPENR